MPLRRLNGTGLLEWRLIAHTMVPLVQCNGDVGARLLYLGYPGMSCMRMRMMASQRRGSIRVPGMLLRLASMAAPSLRLPSPWRQCHALQPGAKRA